MIYVLCDWLIIYIVSSGALIAELYQEMGNFKANAFVFTGNRQQARSLIGSAKPDSLEVIVSRVLNVN